MRLGILGCSLALAAALPACGSADTLTEDGGGGSGAGSSSASTSATTSSGGSASGCPIFPADNAWNTDISSAPVDALSDVYVASIGNDRPFHPDFGTAYGIPFVKVSSSVAKVPVSFDYDDESDPGPYPIPADPPIEDGGDHHILMIHEDECKLYELFGAETSAAGWHAGSGAIWDLESNAQRPIGWTSADAAGLPIFPGLARYEEAVVAKEIRHALRFTTNNTQRGFVAPASHYASNNTDTNLPPMGLRMRLKAGFDVSGFPASVKPILVALQKYGMILADNGSPWYVSGAPDERWSDDDLNTLKELKGSDFEAIETGPITTDVP